MKEIEKIKEEKEEKEVKELVEVEKLVVMRELCNKSLKFNKKSHCTKKKVGI